MACHLVGIKPLSEPNAGILLIRSLGIYFSEILIEIHTFSLKKIHLKMSSVKRRQFCLGLDMLYAIDLALWYWCSFHNIRSTKLRLSDIELQPVHQSGWFQWLIIHVLFVISRLLNWACLICSHRPCEVESRRGGADGGWRDCCVRALHLKGHCLAWTLSPHNTSWWKGTLWT